jgi:hypothetical protein
LVEDNFVRALEAAFIPISAVKICARAATDIKGNSVVCANDVITQAVCRYSIDLRPREKPTGDPHTIAGDPLSRRFRKDGVNDSLVSIVRPEAERIECCRQRYRSQPWLRSGEARPAVARAASG